MKTLRKENIALQDSRMPILKQLRRCGTADIFTIVLLLLSLIPLILLVFNRAFVPFDIDFSQYLHMEIIDRVRTGKPIYVPDGPEYSNGLSYTPLYFWISAAICKLLGPSLVWPRLVTLAACFLACALIASFVWRKTERNLVLSLAAPCFFVSTYSFMNDWMVSLDVNCLHTTLAILGFFILVHELSVRSVVAAALVMSLSMLTKQTGLAYVFAGGILVGIQSRKLAILYAMVALVLLVTSFFWLNLSSRGEFYRIVISAPANDPWVISRLFKEVLSAQVFGMFGLMFTMAIIPILLNIKGGLWDAILKPEYVMCIAGIAVSCIAQPKAGSGETQSLMAFAGLSICGCIGVYSLSKQMAFAFNSRIVNWYVILQLTVLFLPAITHFPELLIDDKDRAKYEAVSNIFRAGKTCFYSFSYLPVVFGQPSSGHAGSGLGLFRKGKSGLDFSTKPASLCEPFRRQEFDYVIIDTGVYPQDPCVKAILETYRPIAQLPAHPKGVKYGNMRFQQIVMQANRILIPLR